MKMDCQVKVTPWQSAADIQKFMSACGIESRLAEKNGVTFVRMNAEVLDFEPGIPVDYRELPELAKDGILIHWSQPISFNGEVIANDKSATVNRRLAQLGAPSLCCMFVHVKKCKSDHISQTLHDAIRAVGL